MGSEYKMLTDEGVKFYKQKGLNEFEIRQIDEVLLRIVVDYDSNEPYTDEMRNEAIEGIIADAKDRIKKKSDLLEKEGYSSEEIKQIFEIDDMGAIDDEYRTLLVAPIRAKRDERIRIAEEQSKAAFKQENLPVVKESTSLSQFHGAVFAKKVTKPSIVEQIFKKVIFSF